MARQVILNDQTLLLAYRIRELRQRKFATAKDAATAFSATPSQWTNWESGSVAPFKSTLEKLAVFFDVDIKYFSIVPENWEMEKKGLLAKLQRSARKNKDRYVLPEPPFRFPASAPQPSPDKANEADEADVFLEITSLINAARNQVKKGTLAKETYEKNMALLAELLNLARSHT